MKAKPGFKITESQFLWFLRLWTAACKTQGWDTLPSKEREAKRHQIIQEATGVTSLKDVSKVQGFDRLKTRLQQLADIVDVSAPPRVRMLHAIGELIPQAVEAKGESWLKSLLSDRFKLFDGLSGLTDLRDHELQQLIITLKERLT